MILFMLNYILMNYYVDFEGKDSKKKVNDSCHNKKKTAKF